ncbi:MAG: aa3-type cytochrome oxidase subunit II [Actinomycetota bacterium]
MRRLTKCLPGLCVLLLLTACGFGAPEGATVQGRDISALYRLFVYVAIAVGGITYALIIWAALRYRRRKDDTSELPRQFRYNVPIEVIYTVVPILIVIALFAVTFPVEQRVGSISPQPDVEVNVTGFKWQWRFDYPEHGISIVGTPQAYPTLVLPVGQTVRINLSAADVIHSFYVPEFLFKRDAIPGMVNRFDLVIPEAGTFRGECAEFCGLDHSNMTFYVRAVPPEEYRRWVEGRSGGGES